MANKLIIAAAGTGKTTKIVNATTEIKEEVLITTFTIENTKEIKKKFIEEKGYLPSNVTIQTWYSFLINEGIKPYQDFLLDVDIKGINMVSGQSASYIAKNNVSKYSFDSKNRLYSDKIAELAFEVNLISESSILKRLEKIYQYIFIDEMQDLAGYDFDIIADIANSTINLHVVGDPRQSILSTSQSSKNKSYSKGKLKEYIVDNSLSFTIDEESLVQSYRCSPNICTLASKLFPEYIEMKSSSRNISQQNIYIVKKAFRNSFLQEFEADQLVLNVNTNANHESKKYTFGDVKGKTLKNILIIPTENMERWLVGEETNLRPKTKAQLYVALTRAEYNVGILTDKAFYPDYYQEYTSDDLNDDLQLSLF